MTENGMIILLGCGFAYAGLIGYFFWTKIRVLGLKADLAKIFLDTRDRATNIGGLDDPLYLHFQGTLRNTIRSASLFSVPVTFYIYLKTSAHRDELKDLEKPMASQNPKLAMVIQESRQRVSNRIARYIGRETFCGWLILLMIAAFPSLTKEELETGASSLINPQELLCV